MCTPIKQNQVTFSEAWILDNDECCPEGSDWKRKEKQLASKTNTDCSFKELLPSSAAANVPVYIEELLKRRLRNSGLPSVESSVFGLLQRPGSFYNATHMDGSMPTFTASGSPFQILWSEAKQRWLSCLEKAACMGYPVTKPIADKLGYSLPDFLTKRINCFRFAIPAEELGGMEVSRLRGLHVLTMNWSIGQIR